MKNLISDRKFDVKTIDKLLLSHVRRNNFQRYIKENDSVLETCRHVHMGTFFEICKVVSSPPPLRMSLELKGNERWVA